MMKVANVIYNYNPKNDDELELKEGDKIEVLGHEEEGWWKGKLRGRVGVFPSNFVKVVVEPNSYESSPVSQNISAAGDQQSNNLSSQSKLLNLLGKSSKTSPSSNSLYSNNTGGNNYNSNNNTNNNQNNYNHNQIMSNTQQQQQQQQASTGEDPSASERRPKPIRGIGYGDIFNVGGAKPKLSSLGSNETASNVERLSSNLAGSLQKQIPKKPPPPAPANTTDDNNSSSLDQAPALPPKPGNQFSPHLHHSKPYPPPPPSSAIATTTTTSTSSSSTSITSTAANIQQSARREQARVIYAYEPSNDDELALEVGDVIDIIQKEIEDQGWWKGELKGKIGVFPDNFVQLITVVPEPSSNLVQQQGVASAQNNMASAQDWNPRTSNQPSIGAQTSSEGKIKSVFGSTPKGFTKELENNLVKQNNNSQASFLSLKRNKVQQQQQQQQMATSESMLDENGKKDADTSGSSSLSSTPKLNHITANRAKGPSRRPPTNLLNKRTQSEQDKPDLNGKDETPMASLPISATSPPVTTNHDNLSSLPTGQQNNSNSIVNSIIGAKLSPLSRPMSESILHSSIVNPSQSIDNITDNHVITPKMSQRLNQQPIVPDKNTKPTTTPSWMLELKKTHAEKRRDNPTTPLQAPTNELADTKPAIVDPPPVLLSSTTASTTAAATTATTTTTSASANTYSAPAPQSLQLETQNAEDKRLSVQSVRGSYEASAPTTVVTSAFKNLSSRYSMESNPMSIAAPALATATAPAPVSTPVTAPTPTSAVQKDSSNNEVSVHYENLVKQISNNLQSEISELKDEIKRLQIDFQDIKELKSVVEVMKIELKACQSATESQKKWMKDLVDNLADERKKIAAMQIEIDRNLK